MIVPSISGVTETSTVISGAMEVDEPGSIFGLTSGALGWGMGGGMGR